MVSEHSTIIEQARVGKSQGYGLAGSLAATAGLPQAEQEEKGQRGRCRKEVGKSGKAAVQVAALPLSSHRAWASHVTFLRLSISPTHCTGH